MFEDAIYSKNNQMSGIAGQAKSAAANRDSLDRQLREAALRLAHNTNEGAAEVIARAQAYIAFIEG